MISAHIKNAIGGVFMGMEYLFLILKLDKKIIREGFQKV
jgi:hypothetical protein